MWSCVCVNRLLKRLMSPSPKSQVMFASAFSWIVDFFVFLAFIVFTLRPLCWICMQWTDAADGGCGGGLDFAPMHAIHRYTRPNCNNVAITGISHMSLALLNHWRWIGEYSLTLGYYIQGEHWPRRTKNIQHTFDGYLSAPVIYFRDNPVYYFLFDHGLHILITTMRIKGKVLDHIHGLIVLPMYSLFSLQCLVDSVY